MSRLLGVVLFYVAMVLACSGVGLFMLIAPARFGNLVHESLLLYPEVNPGDWGKKLVLRLLGTGFLAFGIRLVIQIAHQAN
ncbi:MAG TPA: hypothetical protein VN841_26970 [Bryobacteraceae bacterium]|nr:hypothetical protein [Bryobacteraceae bacterium]